MVSFAAFPTFAYSKSTKQKETPTKITSDVIDIKRNSQTVNFYGNVVVEKADSSLLADEMKVLYDEKKGAKGKAKKGQNASTIKRIDAKNNVKIFSEEFIATGNAGYYDPKKNIFVLEDNVTVNNGVSIASGNQFIYKIKEKRGNFVGRKNEALIGGRQRVIVVIGDDIQEQDNQNKQDNK